MKINKIIFPVAALSLAFAACDDQVMEWRDGDPTVTGSDIPMELKEKIANYDFIKNYMAEYHPGVDITLGMGLDNFLDDEAYRQVVLDNYQGVTFGNAMKHQSVVQTNGSYNWDKVDQFIAMNTGLKLHGHNLLWHTQQQQNYLRKLIAPEQIISGGNDGGIENVVTNGDFESGNDNGWSGWSHYTKTVEAPGHDSNYALKCVTDAETSVNYDCQLWWSVDLEPGVTYAYSFYIKSPDGVEAQFVGQNANFSGIYKSIFTGTDNWTLCEGEFEYKDSDPADVCRVGLQFGGIKNATLWVDDFKFGRKVEGPANLCPNGNFADGIEGWNVNNPGAGVETVEMAGAPSGNKNVMKMTSSSSSEKAWDLQVVSGDIPSQHGKKVEVSFYVKSEGAGKGRLSFKGLTNEWPWMNWTGDQSSWTEAFETSDNWTQIKVVLQNYSVDFDESADVWKISMDFGYVPDMTYYIDNVLVTVVDDEAKAPMRAPSITYALKTPEEKKAILLGAMEEWIKEAMTHAGPACSSWDVINEPIGDNCQIRGIEGGWSGDDSEPVETTESGLNLNWANEAGNGHFYWGYYCGMDYAVKAFEYAAKYNPNGAKLFVNDYNLESNPNKLAKLIEFVEYIDNNGAHVDGIGTQMHVSSSISKEQVDAMFKTLAATGKLIRITELDITVGTKTPSADQLQKQADCYHMILTSYFENIPENQQSAITLWTLSDNEKEHEYWLKDDAPNVFDASYGRKLAYKSVCDAIAGKDVSADFRSHDYSKK